MCIYLGSCFKYECTLEKAIYGNPDSNIAREISNEKQQKIIKVIEEGKAVENIRVMTDTIVDITEQINLLALNEITEAARDGEM
ncbi:hypothetical protein LF65_01677 [Clostridium beijerinckii]|uniref:Methyl-accepting transducer domain-containing protein n=1 Tax=Clostridium beijerinckii TaxID=1520 RepID=A0A0B5QJA2_CLOBE|nr:hypothetical protein [Clostridium beijerinckii]AJG98281.1 hypothetical protein LF65_01677 [Clostridium beijerinckii]